jgi:hypothetical protein
LRVAPSANPPAQKYTVTALALLAITQENGINPLFLTGTAQSVVVCVVMAAFKTPETLTNRAFSQVDRSLA